jgi:uncharacterized MnhB-related membrane protein
MLTDIRSIIRVDITIQISQNRDIFLFGPLRAHYEQSCYIYRSESWVLHPGRDSHHAHWRNWGALIHSILRFSLGALLTNTVMSANLKLQFCILDATPIIHIDATRVHSRVLRSTLGALLISTAMSAGVKLQFFILDATPIIYIDAAGVHWYVFYSGPLWAHY